MVLDFQCVTAACSKKVGDDHEFFDPTRGLLQIRAATVAGGNSKTRRDGFALGSAADVGANDE